MLRLAIANHVIHKDNKLIGILDLRYTPPLIVVTNEKDKAFSDLTVEEKKLIINYILFHYKNDIRS